MSKSRHPGSSDKALTTRIIAALVAGLVLGAVISAAGSRQLQSVVGWIEPLGELWVNAIRMTVVPLVVALLISGVASVANVSTVRLLGARTLFTFLAILLLVAVVTLIVAPPMFSLLHIDAAGMASIKAASAVTGAPVEVPGFRQWLVSTIPTNAIKAAADGAMLPLVVFSLAFALATMKTGGQASKTLVDFFDSLGDAMLTLVHWVIRAAPVGVFALTLSLAARLGASVAGSIGLYILIICGLYFACTLLMYPIAALVGGVSLREFAKAMSPAQAAALSTRSSLASLPALIEAAEARLELPPAVTGFVLPLAVSVFRPATPITLICSTLLLGHLYGVPISAEQLLTMAVISLFFSFTAPGIPSGGLFIMAPVFVSVGLPAEGVGILIAIDIFPDAARTVLNVTGDAVTAAIVANRLGGARSISHSEAALSDAA